MRSYKREDKGRDQKNMGYKKPRDRERAHLRAAADQTLNALANPGNFTDGISSYSGGKISSLVPGKQVASEGHSQNQAEEQAPREPKKLAPPFVRSVDVGLREVQEQNHDHRAGAVGVQAAEKRSSRDRLGYVSDRRVRMIGGGNVVQR